MFFTNLRFCDFSWVPNLESHGCQIWVLLALILMSFLNICPWEYLKPCLFWNKPKWSTNLHVRKSESGFRESFTSNWKLNKKGPGLDRNSTCSNQQHSDLERYLVSARPNLLQTFTRLYLLQFILIPPLGVCVFRTSFGWLNFHCQDNSNAKTTAHWPSITQLTCSLHVPRIFPPFWRRLTENLLD